MVRGMGEIEWPGARESQRSFFFGGLGCQRPPRPATCSQTFPNRRATDTRRFASPPSARAAPCAHRVFGRLPLSASSRPVERLPSTRWSPRRWAPRPSPRARAPAARPWRRARPRPQMTRPAPLASRRPAPRSAPPPATTASTPPAPSASTPTVRPSVAGGFRPPARRPPPLGERSAPQLPPTAAYKTSKLAQTTLSHKTTTHTHHPTTHHHPSTQQASLTSSTLATRARSSRPSASTRTRRSSSASAPTLTRTATKGRRSWRRKSGSRRCGTAAGRTR
jgi:hypothetical protein